MTDEPGPWGSRDRPAGGPASGSTSNPAPASGRGRGYSGSPGAAALLPQNDRQRLILNIVSTVLLAAFLTWRAGPMWALAAVVGVFVHEYGHVLAMNVLGCGPGRIHIIPFLGGAAVPRIPPPTEFKGVLIALAGPVFGLLASLPFFAAAWYLRDPQWLEGAFVIGLINLVNLAPAPPLDGSKALGPALARIHPMVEKAAIVIIGGVAIVVTFMMGYRIMPIFLALGIFGALRSGSLRPFALKLTGGEWAASFGLYLASIGLCALTLYGVAYGLGFTDDPAHLIQLLASKL
jgi:hypothetical protein